MNIAHYVLSMSPMKFLKKQSKVPFLRIALSLVGLLGCYLGISSFQDYRQTSDLELLTSGYPRAFFFRRSENVTSDYDTWERTFSRLGGIMGKTQNEELLGRKLSLPFFQKYKREHPLQAVFLHYNGNARDPLDGDAFFDGHWIYYEGTNLLEDINAREGEMMIKVADASLFKMNIGRYNNKNDDLAICKKNKDGSLDWSYAEQLKLVNADYKNNILTVRRAQYGSTSRKFDAANSVVSPHAVEGPWGEKNNLLWLYNHSDVSPRNKDGKTCDDILIQEIASKFKLGGELFVFDGVEFDVLWNELKTENNETSRKADVDANGKGDNGLVKGINVYSVGVFNFCKNLRSAIGPEKLIMADGMTSMFQRGVGYLNGIESEGWPHLKDPEVNDWSGGWNRHLFWNENSFQPSFNYINFKYAQNITPPPIGRQRLGWAVAQMLGVNVTSSGYILEKPADGIRIAINDEFVAGNKQKKYWLGYPKGPTVRLALQQPDLLKNKGIKPDEGFLKNIAGENLAVKLEGNVINLKSSKQGNMKFAIENVPANGPDLMISFKVKCDPRTGYPVNMPRLLNISYKGDAQKIMTFCNGKWFNATFYFRDVKEEKLIVQFDIESNELLSIKDITVHAYPDVAYRLFDNGLVLANPSLKPFEFDLKKIAPGIKLARLQGTAIQDVITNNGKMVSDKLMIGEREGLFLEVTGK